MALYQIHPLGRPYAKPKTNNCKPNGMNSRPNLNTWQRLSKAPGVWFYLLNLRVRRLLCRQIKRNICSTSADTMGRIIQSNARGWTSMRTPLVSQVSTRYLSICYIILNLIAIFVKGSYDICNIFTLFLALRCSLSASSITGTSRSRSICLMSSTCMSVTFFKRFILLLYYVSISFMHPALVFGGHEQRQS